MHSSFILQYMYYIKYLDMFRAILCSTSGGKNCIFTASGIVTLCERPCTARPLVIKTSLYYDARSEKHIFLPLLQLVVNKFLS
jgi:hypothetical protein